MLESPQSGLTGLSSLPDGVQTADSIRGAIYHVINRGNDPRDLFETLGTKQALANCMFA
jgi:hypothetical protein